VDTIVRALRFADGKRERPADRTSMDRRRVTRIELGSIVAFVYGDGGACFEAVVLHLRSVGR
jgi:hypothetical protein